MENKTPPPLSSSKNKRSRVNSSSSDEDTPALELWPAFLLIKEANPDLPLTGLSPFAINKAIIGIAGKPKDIKRIRSGALLVQVTKKSHSDNLMKTTTLVDRPVLVEPHRTLNSVKGVIRERELLNTDEQEMLIELKSQGVTEVRQIKVRRDGVLRKTATVILTFGLTKLPPHVKVGFVRLPVDQYIPSPLRCFKCQRFGHHRNTCKRDDVCARCAERGHTDVTCKAVMRCANCKGEHSAYSKDCPEWKRESEITRLKTLENISFPEARKRVDDKYRSQSKTYAQAATKCHVNVCCQTNLTWPIQNKQPSQLPEEMTRPVRAPQPPPRPVSQVGQTQTNIDVARKLTELRSSMSLRQQHPPPPAPGAATNARPAQSTSQNNKTHHSVPKLMDLAPLGDANTAPINKPTLQNEQTSDSVPQPMDQAPSGDANTPQPTQSSRKENKKKKKKEQVSIEDMPNVHYEPESDFNRHDQQGVS